MLRLLGPRSSAYRSTNYFLIQLTRSVSNQIKTAPSSQSSDRQVKSTNTRRFPNVTPRQVDLRKLFSDEPTESVATPTGSSPPPSRRSTVNSSAPTSSTQTRYEEDIANVDDYRTEEKRRLTARQTQNKKLPETKPIQTDFDGLELIESKFDEKNVDQRKRMTNQKETTVNQPRQPRKERSLTDPVSPVGSLEDINQTRSTGVLTNSIKETKTIDELLNIFDSYILPTEFAMGLQKLCQMSSVENNNAVHLYQQGEKRRQRVETLLLSFLNKFSDHEVVKSITFVSKFYPEDNEFTDKFSLALNGRLRRISVHQIVTTLEELKVSRHTAQWIHRTYNRLLSLAEGRYFEFDNIKDILSLTYKLSYNDRLISRLDERILEIADSLTFDDWFKVLINKSMLKRRDRTIIRAACYHLLKLSESSVFPLEKIKDSLLACAMLNVYDKPFLERLIRDAFEQIHELKDPFVIQSIITSMGTLRLRHCELLDAFGRFLLEESKSLSTLKDKCIQSFIRTCAAVNYSPSTLPALIANHLSLDAPTNEENNPLADAKHRIDLVWSLAILDQADANHVGTVLNQNVSQLIQNEVSNSKIASALKLLAIYSYSLQKFSKKFLKPTFNVEQLAQLLTVKNANAQEQLAKTVTAFAAENKYSKFNVVTSNMIVIDCLMVVDKQGIPQDLATVMTSTESNTQTTYNKMRISDSHTKIVLKCLDYQDKTLLTDSVSGPLALQMKLLNSLGYKCVPIHYDEFIKIQVPQDRVKYLQLKIKETIQPTTTTTTPTASAPSSPMRRKRNDDEDDW